MNVSKAAMDVEYVSSSQFSREFRRLCGQSPRQWSNNKQLPEGVTLQTALFFYQPQHSKL